MSNSKWYSVRTFRAAAAVAASAASGAALAAATTAEIWIYGDIGESWWNETVTAKDLCKEIAALEADEIRVRINSYGGSVSDGIAIYTALRSHGARIVTSAEGVAASIASLIFMAGEDREIADSARLMIHAPWAVAAGNATELREVAEQLDGWSRSMASSYARATGKTVDDVLSDWLADGKDHWYGADEAVTAGLATKTTEALPIAASGSRFAWASTPAQARAARQPEPAPQHQPAAAAAPSLETTMPGQQTQNPAAPNTSPQDTEAVQAAIRAEARRQADIRGLFAHYKHLEGASAACDECLADTGITLERAKSKVLDLHAKGVEPVAGNYVATLADERDKFRAGVRTALEARANVGKSDTANPYRGYSLTEMARACLVHAGVRDAMPGDKMGLVAMAFTHSSSDFPLLLANVAQKSMMKGYEESDETFQMWTSEGTLPDFKIASSVDLGSFPALRQVAEGGEYKYITVGERREQRVLATYGERFSITRPAIINDDLDAFSRMPRKMGRAAIRTVGNLAYAVLTGNPNMADGTALFHASRNNLQSAAGVNSASVDAVRVAMARMKDIGQTTGSLNIRLRYLVVPVALEGAAKATRDSEYEVGASAKNNTTPNTVRGTFEVVSDARLDDASTSVWYGAADPGLHDTVIVDYLDGVKTPTLEQQAGWSVDGVEFKVRMDAAAKALDPKTMQRVG